MNLLKLVSVLFFAIISIQCFSQNASVIIVNEQNKKSVFTVADLNSFSATSLNIEAEDGTPHNYSGVDLYALLAKAGVSFGKDARKQVLNIYMQIKAADNYSVIYALAEIDTFLSAKKIILATTKDGKSLVEGYGPFQIITTGEKRHARMVRQVTEIDVRKVE